MLSSLTKRRAALTAGLVVSVCLWLALSSSLFPALSDDPPQNLQVIQSDDPRVIREEQWTTQTAAGASGGSYLYNTAVNPDRPDPALLLQFSGTYLEVVYVSGPNLGILAIEVDGTVLRTIITANDRADYNQRTTINYLTDERHTLRVYAQSGGVVGVDAFVVTTLPQISTLTPVKDNSTDTTSNVGPRVVLCDSNRATRVVSSPLNSTGGASNASYSPAMSSDGRYIVFDSIASDFATNDTNSTYDVILVDLQTCTNRLISQTSSGTIGNNSSRRADISNNGRFIVYETFASNLSGMNNPGGERTIVIHDQQYTGVRVVPVSPSGTSSVGRNPDISGNGMDVAFESNASNIVNGDTNNLTDIFVRFMGSSHTLRASVRSDGTQMTTGTVSNPSISDDARYVVFEGTNADLMGTVISGTQVYLHNRLTHETRLISEDSLGISGNGNSSGAKISGNGQYIIFESLATNLVANDTNAFSDIYLYEMATDTLSLLTLGYDGLVSTNNSREPAISTNGRYVTFLSYANNIVPNYSGQTNVYWLDRQTGSIAPVGVNSYGSLAYGLTGTNEGEAPVSDNGQIVAFDSTATNLGSSASYVQQLYVRDINAAFAPYSLLGATVSPSSISLQWSSSEPNVTEFHIERSTNNANAFAEIAVVGPSNMTYLDTGLNPNTLYYYRVRVYRGSDGRFSGYSNVVNNQTQTRNNPGYVNITVTGRTSIELSWTDTNSFETEYHVERRLASGGDFEEIAILPATASTYTYSDTNLAIFTGYSYRIRAYWASDSQFSNYSSVYSATTYPACAPNALVQRVAMDNNGMPVNARDADMNSDGRYIVFSTTSPVPSTDTANYFYQVYVHDRLTCNTTLVSRSTDSQRGNDDARMASISDDGRWIAFASEAINLVPNTTVRVYQIYLHDRQTGQTILVSHSPDGVPGDALSQYPRLSSDGRFIVFGSDATNLVLNDAVPAVSDVYVYDRLTDQITRVSVDNSGNAGNGYSSYPSISDDGRYVAFESAATNLDPSDTNTDNDIFVHDRQIGQTSVISTRIDGTPTVAGSYVPMISGNGRYVVFFTVDPLSSEPIDNQGQVYLRDLQTGTFELISRAPDGSYANSLSEYPIITPDGRFIFFSTAASNLGDNGPAEMFNIMDNYVYDRVTQTNYNVNRDYQGNVAPVGSGGGRGAISDDGLITLWYGSSWVLPYSGGSGYYIYNRNYSPSPTPTPTASDTPTSTATLTPSPTDTPTATASDTPSQTPSNTPTHTATITPSPTDTPTATASDTPSQTPSNTPTPTPTITPSPTATATNAAHCKNVRFYGAWIADIPGVLLYGLSNTSGQPIQMTGFELEWPVSNEAIPWGGLRAELIPSSAVPIFAQTVPPGTLIWSGNDTDSLTLFDPTNPARQEGVWEAGVMLPSGSYAIALIFSQPDVVFSELPNFDYARFDDSHMYVEGCAVLPISPPELHLPTMTPSHTALPTSTPSDTPTQTATASVIPSYTPTATRTASATSTQTPTRTPTSTATVTQTASNTPSPTKTFTPMPTKTVAPPTPDTLAIYDTQLQRLYLLDALHSQATPLHTVQLSNPNPIVGVMGDWNGDGLKTPGYYAGGIFYTTNLLTPTQFSDWDGTWFGWTTRPIVAGRFAGSDHDCVGVVDSGYFPPYGTAFALYYTCDFSQINPPKDFQWLSIVLPDNQGFSGTHQFETGDFDGDGYDSVAVRRGAFIAYTNVSPGAGHAAFAYAQYWGYPDLSSEGEFVSGDWDGDGLDNFGVYYPTSHLFYRRHDLLWNGGAYYTQSLPALNPAAVSVSSWRVR